MPKQMEYRAFGLNLSATYWELVQFSFSLKNKTGNLLFYGYADASAREANEKPIGSKTYQITPQNFEQYYAMINERSDIVINSYQLAVETKDVITEDPNKPLSFFQNAIDV